MRNTIPIALTALLVIPAAFADQAAEAGEDGPTRGSSQTQSWRFGAAITAGGSTCKSVSAAAPFPMEWPEQSVKIVQEDVPSSAKLSFRSVKGVGGLAKQFVASVAVLPAGKTSEITVTVSVTRSAIVPPVQTSMFLVPDPKRLKPEERACLQPSRHIESDVSRIQSLAHEITAPQSGAWQQVEALYNWTRSHIKDRAPAGKGALKAIEGGSGDALETSCVFVALCRAAGVPARLVWLPRYCYPEFLLADGEGRTWWFPCRAVGNREFGGITEYRPILSKGDKFPSGDKPNETDRFVAEQATGLGGQPSVKFMRELASKP